MKRKGFTLIEIIIALALLGIILVLFTPLLANSFSALNVVSDKNKYYTATNIALDYMKSVLAQATNVEIVDRNSSDSNGGSIYCSENGDFFIVYDGVMEYGLSRKNLDGNSVRISFVKQFENSLEATVSIVNGTKGLYTASTVIALTALYNFDTNSKGEINVNGSNCIKYTTLEAN